jgi:hypothetical protein
LWFSSKGIWRVWGVWRDIGFVFKLRPSDGTILAKVGVSGNLEGLAFDGADMWVVGVTIGAVVKL